MKLINIIFLSAAAAALGLLLVACGTEDTQAPPKEIPKETGAVDALQSLALPAAPAETQPVLAAIQANTFGSPVTVSGKVGEIADGRAAFRLADVSLQDCNKGEDHCETPWDYCCVPSNEMKAGSVMVEFKDESGALLKGKLEGVGKLGHLAHVVVTGTMRKDEAGNLFMDGSGFFVTAPSPLK